MPGMPGSLARVAVPSAMTTKRALMSSPWLVEMCQRLMSSSQFSPVTRVKHEIGDTRVGQKTNYDKLIIEIWTNGTVTPQMALVEGAKILRKHLNPFIQYAEPGPEIGMGDLEQQTTSGGDQVDVELERKLNMSLAELELSVRATNCLESEGITTVRDLVIRNDDSPGVIGYEQDTETNCHIRFDTGAVYLPHDGQAQCSSED